MAYLPRILAALAIVVVGFLLAAALRAVASRILRWIRFDQVIERVGAGQLLRKISAAPAHATVAKGRLLADLDRGALVALKALGVSGTDRPTLQPGLESVVAGGRHTAFAIVFGGVMLGAAIAFGRAGDTPLAGLSRRLSSPGARCRPRRWLSYVMASGLWQDRLHVAKRHPPPRTIAGDQDEAALRSLDRHQAPLRGHEQR